MEEQFTILPKCKKSPSMSHTLDSPRGTKVWNSLKKPLHQNIYKIKGGAFFKHQFEQNNKCGKRKISVELTFCD